MDDDIQHPVSVGSRILGCSEKTYRQKCDNGEIKATRTSTGVRLVTERELQRVLALRRDHSE